jgi:hypothetical protein
VTHTKPTFWALLPSRARKCSHGPFANWSRQGRSVHGHRGDDLLLQDVCYLDPYGLRDGVLRVQERRIHLPPGACGSSHQLPHGPPTHEAAHHAVKRARQNVGNLRSPEMGKSFPPPQKAIRASKVRDPWLRIRAIFGAGSRRSRRPNRAAAPPRARVCSGHR